MRIGLLAIAAIACGPEDGSGAAPRSPLGDLVPGTEDTFHIDQGWFDASRLDCARPTGDGVTLRVYGMAATESAQVDFRFPGRPEDGSQWRPGADGFSVRGLITDRVVFQDHAWHPDTGRVTVERRSGGLVLRWNDLSVGGAGVSDGYVSCSRADPETDAPEDVQPLD